MYHLLCSFYLIWWNYVSRWSFHHSKYLNNNDDQSPLLNALGLEPMINLSCVKVHTWCRLCDYLDGYTIDKQNSHQNWFQKSLPSHIVSIINRIYVILGFVLYIYKIGGKSLLYAFKLLSIWEKTSYWKEFTLYNRNGYETFLVSCLDSSWCKRSIRERSPGWIHQIHFQEVEDKKSVLGYMP